MVTMASSATGNVTTTPLSPDVSTTTAQKKSSENRRSNKPIMEKRRRARINHSLNELKTLILDAMKKDPARHSKLEKADILEMTVKHLETLHKQQAALSTITDKYRAGFSECANEVTRFPGLDKTVRERLLQHLKNCLNSTAIAAAASGGKTNDCSVADLSSSGGRLGGGGGGGPNLQVHILPSSETSSVVNNHNGIYLSAGANNGGVQLVPTRLPNGDIALILPSSSANGIQQRIAVSPSPSSTSSSPPPLSMINHHHHHQQHHLQHSRSASTDSAASSNSSIPLDRLSVNIPASSSSVDEMCHSPSSVHSNYSSSPRSPMSASNVYDSYGMQYSPDSQKPLSLVVREGYIDANDEKPWRPW